MYTGSTQAYNNEVVRALHMQVLLFDDGGENNGVATVTNDERTAAASSSDDTKVWDKTSDVK